MSTYKVIQDVEAEDKLVGPLSLRQFIYAAIAALLMYLSFFAYTKHVAFLMIFFIPAALFALFLAIPWRGDQPTEVWAVAKLRFLMKPRKRLWDQSGAKNLVTITVPKRVERQLTKGLSQNEVRSRLYALASTIDSRGWAVKNSHPTATGMDAQVVAGSDRLVEPAMLPQEVSDINVSASDDVLDATSNPIAQQFDSMMQTASSTQHQQLLQDMQASHAQAPSDNVSPQQATSSPGQNYWFNVQPQAPTQTTSPSQSFSQAAPFAPSYQAAAPTAEEIAIIERSMAENQQSFGADDHLKRIMTPDELAAAAAQPAMTEPNTVAPIPVPAVPATANAQVTSDTQAAIMDMVNNDDLSVATIARQVNKKREDDQEVVIPLR